MNWARSSIEYGYWIGFQCEMHIFIIILGTAGFHVGVEVFDHLGGASMALIGLSVAVVV